MKYATSQYQQSLDQMKTRIHRHLGPTKPPSPTKSASNTRIHPPILTGLAPAYATSPITAGTPTVVSALAQRAVKVSLNP